MLCLYVLAWLCVGACAVPVLVLFIECAASLFPRRPAAVSGERRSIALLVPAHNEELVIGPTVRSLKAALLSGDRLIVVADNCDDETAQIAAAEGATVLERNDTVRRGKGFALSHGIAAMRADPPSAVIVFDADIPVTPSTVDVLARAVERYQKPVQARYVLSSPANAGVRGVVSSLAFITKNVVRPAGMRAMGFPCPLLGTGMAFPWDIISKANIRGGHLVEDMQLGVDLLRDGYPTVFCEQASVDGELPDRGSSALQQRTRWEHGHLSVIRTMCLPLLRGGLVRGRIDMVAAAFDLCIPPLALLSIAWVGVSVLTVVAALVTKQWAPPIGAAGVGALLVLSVLMAWWRAGRHLPLLTLAAAPLYVLWKVPLYLRFIFKPQKSWVRTERSATVSTPEGVHHA